MHVDKGNVILSHGRKVEMGKKVIVKIDIGLAGIKHHPITVKNNG